MEISKISFVEFKERVTQNHSFSSQDDQNLAWLRPIKMTLGILRERTLDLSIYKVPSKIRRLSKEDYTPRVVSIGPFHRNNPDLLAMEERKWRHMLSLLHRTPNPETCLNECGKAIRELEATARGSYAESIKFDSYQLVEIMLVDGCFILELFLRHLLKERVENTDPILHNAWMLPTLRHDLALLENQIPFFLLQQLFDIVMPQMDTGLPLHITDLALSFFHPEMQLGQKVIKEKCNYGSRHLLDLLHNFYNLKSPRMGSLQGKKTWGFKNCATKLLEAGIVFEMGSKEDHLLDIKFSNGVIKIPTLCIHETTNSLLKNLIAFEQCSLGSTHHVTSYAILMKSLIHSPQDVDLLERNGIIEKDLGAVEYEDVLSLFNNILKEVALKDFCFVRLCEEVNEYHKSYWHWHRHKALWRLRWHRYVGALKRDYFSNPWRIIGFVAAVLLLLLTGVQTFYTVRSYYPH